MDREPFHNTVTIECGNGLTTQYTIDLALLCAQSERQLEIFTQAEPLRDQHKQAMALKKRAEAFHSLLIVYKIHQVDDVRAKVRAHLPLPSPLRTFLIVFFLNTTHRY